MIMIILVVRIIIIICLQLGEREVSKNCKITQTSEENKPRFVLKSIIYHSPLIYPLKEVGVEGVTQKHVEQDKMGSNGDLVVSVIDGLKNKDGYTRLEDIPSHSGSLTDLREVQHSTDQSCCSCSLM